MSYREKRVRMEPRSNPCLNTVGVSKAIAKSRLELLSADDETVELPLLHFARVWKKERQSVDGRERGPECRNSAEASQPGHSSTGCSTPK